jgi:ABC-2 type transport system ATP-binding protein
MQDPIRVQDPVLLVEGLKKSFDKKAVLKDIHFKVYPGQIIGYIGPNGAGKSTTVKIFLGMLEKDSGQIHMFGQPLQKGEWKYKHRIGYVPEQSEVYENLTASEYLEFVGGMYGMTPEEIDEKALALLDLFGIGQSYHSRIASYSKGMRQKLLIIAAMIHDPDILFLDEPLSGLDANSVMVFKEILARLKARGKTIFYSSHIMEVVEKLSDRILLLSNGEIVADGTFEDLRAKSAEGSLQDIFNQLTGFNEHAEIAEKFDAILKRRSS